MGRESDSQVDWFGLARLLSRKGYLVLTYNRRGICPGGQAGCSRGFDDYESSWKDVVGAVDFVRDRGAEKTVLVGASIGAMAALHAAAEGRIAPDGLVEFGGINHASGYDFDRSQIHRIGGSKLFLSSRTDIYGGGDAAPRPTWRDELWERHFPGKPERDRLLLALMAYAGLRRSELLGLDWDDVDLSRRLLRVRKARGGRQRTIPIHPALAPLFAEYYATRVPLTEQAVFVGVQGNRLHYTQLGHKHLDSTQRYTRVNAHELRGAVKRLRWVGG